MDRTKVWGREAPDEATDEIAFQASLRALLAAVKAAGPPPDAVLPAAADETAAQRVRCARRTPSPER